MRTAGVAFILLALTGLWLYNTGRLEAVLAVIKDPSYKPGKTQFVAGLGTIPAGGQSYASTGLGSFGTPSINGSEDFGTIIGGIFDAAETIGGIFA